MQPTQSKLQVSNHHKGHYMLMAWSALFIMKNQRFWNDWETHFKIQAATISLTMVSTFHSIFIIIIYLIFWIILWNPIRYTSEHDLFSQDQQVVPQYNLKTNTGNGEYLKINRADGDFIKHLRMSTAVGTILHFFLRSESVLTIIWRLG